MRDARLMVDLSKLWLGRCTTLQLSPTWQRLGHRRRANPQQMLCLSLSLSSICYCETSNAHIISSSKAAHAHVISSKTCCYSGARARV